MMRFAILLALAAGCNGAPHRPADLSKAEELRKQGRMLEAVQEYALKFAETAEADPVHIESRARIVHELVAMNAHETVARADDRTRGGIIERIPSLADPTGRDLTTAAIGAYMAVLASLRERQEALVYVPRITELLRRKLVTPALRRASVAADKPFDELLYRRLLTETIADYEVFAVMNQTPGGRAGDRAAAAMEELSAASQRVADHASIKPAAADYWASRAKQEQSRAHQVRARPADARLDADRTAVAGCNVNRLFEFAQQQSDHAIGFVVAKEPLALQLGALEEALRRWFLAFEAVPHPTARQQDMLKSAIMAIEMLHDAVK